MILSCWALWYGSLDTLNIKIYLQIAEIFFSSILATREAVAPPTNDPIMWGRSIQSFRHPEHQNQSIISDSINWAPFACLIRSYQPLKFQNLSTGDDFIDSIRIIFLVPFWILRRHWRHLPMFLSCREDQYGHLDTLNVKIPILFQIL